MSGSPQDTSGPATQASSITELRSRSDGRRSGVRRGLVDTVAVLGELPVIQTTAAASEMSDGKAFKLGGAHLRVALGGHGYRRQRPGWARARRHRGHSRTHLAQRQAAAGRLATFNAFMSADRRQVPGGGMNGGGQ